MLCGKNIQIICCKNQLKAFDFLIHDPEWFNQGTKLYQHVANHEYESTFQTTPTIIIEN
ncbi:hypothetical protein PIROE2DRAFT_15643 [Piromyces sp. E2]|nr:hypothetical protein PIROE2DRAFT_15643 [Piromyces sp. E2]|eukprot:OUM58957.1 hypothetical protein PIROE2DRAFT_15643 [Piromyces sp. E2]